MKKHFYSHLIETKELEIELDSLDLKPEEKDELLSHVHGSIHYKVLGTVLSDLSEDDKKILIEHINNDDHERTWDHLLKNTVGIEEKLKKGVEKVIQEFRDEIAKISLPKKDKVFPFSRLSRKR